jgi:hypothetical protein
MCNSHESYIDTCAILSVAFAISVIQCWNLLLWGDLSRSYFIVTEHGPLNHSNNQGPQHGLSSNISESDCTYLLDELGPKRIASLVIACGQLVGRTTYPVSVALKSDLLRS